MDWKIISYENEKFNELMQQYEAAIKIIKTKLELIDQELNFKYGHSPIHVIQYRIKSIESIKGKLKRKKLDQTVAAIKKLYDIAGIRVICNYLNDIQYIAQLLVNQDDITQIKHSNYIQYPKNNGYRSFHLIVSVPVYQKDGKINVPVEIQIRTIAMDCWASLEHELCYKNESKTNNDIKIRLKECADKMAQSDLEMQKIYLEINRPWDGNR